MIRPVAFPLRIRLRKPRHFQGGLSWLTILRKNFDPEKVARFAETGIVKLLANAGIVRLGAGDGSNSPRFWAPRYLTPGFGPGP